MTKKNRATGRKAKKTSVKTLAPKRTRQVRGGGGTGTYKYGDIELKRGR